ncbi:hypothetical protein RJ640_015328 [Escallonia rubra]|uniref:Glycosyltransferase subfamily 4-like N-terminal domain-containing protein n=1 Tax=Escallonia rubra TaxID=112253 RepID=A0AA88RZK5_9ASTE|nr:hypothetical protein RJ640_015328 [Escallonia rubra]
MNDRKSTSIHIMALDGIVNVNSLFTLAVFLGLSINPNDPSYTLVDPASACAAGTSVAENLVAFHVYSFSSFLFSSLVASGLKQAIKMTAKEGSAGVVDMQSVGKVNREVLRAGILASALGLASGCVFLTLALVDLVQIKLGKLGCWSWYDLAAIGPLKHILVILISIMSKDHVSFFSFRFPCYIVIFLSAFSSISFLYWSHCSRSCSSSDQKMVLQKENQQINLLTYPFAWNHLAFSSEPPPKLLKIALFVKKWPTRYRAGGLERHALTLHLALAKRGHELHIFTTSSSNSSFPKYPNSNLHFHLTKATAAGYLNQAVVWSLFQAQNSSGNPFDVIHTESVGLLHTRSRNITKLAVSWHGIAYESIHSDIIQELLRAPEEPRAYALTERAMKVVEEVKFFPDYAHHVATSDHAGDILKRIYMIPEERVHVILNGIDEEVFKPDVSRGNDFKMKFGIPESKSLVIGMASRLVKDKGHPVMFEALKQILSENSTFKEHVIILVAGDGPWGARYKDLGANLLVLGPLEQEQLARFYNAIDIFVNPTLRAQGLDHTLLEAVLSGTPVMATKLASITGSVIVGKEVGYTFSPTVASLRKSLYEVWGDGRGILEQRGKTARERGLNLFTATKMAAAYERLFLCISCEGKQSTDYCSYQP